MSIPKAAIDAAAVELWRCDHPDRSPPWTNDEPAPVSLALAYGIYADRARRALLAAGATFGIGAEVEAGREFWLAFPEEGARLCVEVDDPTPARESGRPVIRVREIPPDDEVSA